MTVSMSNGDYVTVTTTNGLTLSGRLGLTGSEAIWLYHDDGIHVIWLRQIISVIPA